MSNVVFGGLTFVSPDTLSFSNLPTLIDNVVVPFGSPLKDNDVVLKFNKSGVDISSNVLLWDDGVKTAMQKWQELKNLEGTLSTLVANGESLTNVVLISGGTPKKQITDKGYTVVFTATFRRIEE